MEDLSDILHIHRYCFSHQKAIHEDNPHHVLPLRNQQLIPPFCSQPLGLQNPDWSKSVQCQKAHAFHSTLLPMAFSLPEVSVPTPIRIWMSIPEPRLSIHDQLCDERFL